MMGKIHFYRVKTAEITAEGHCGNHRRRSLWKSPRKVTTEITVEGHRGNHRGRSPRKSPRKVTAEITAEGYLNGFDLVDLFKFLMK